MRKVALGAVAVGYAIFILPLSAPHASAETHLYMKSKGTGKCLHQEGGTMNNGDKISQWDCRKQTNIALRKLDRGNGQFMLQFVHSDKCVHLHGASRDNGAAITQWDCEVGKKNLLWRQEAAGEGYFYIRSVASNKCIQVHEGLANNGTSITQWDCVKRPNVHWKFATKPSG
jgi:hypothetical protein